MSSLKSITMSYSRVPKIGTRPHTEQMLNESSGTNRAQSRGLHCVRCAPCPPPSPGVQCLQNGTHTSLSTHFSATILQLSRCHLASPLSHFRCHAPRPALSHHWLTQSYLPPLWSPKPQMQPTLQSLHLRDTAKWPSLPLLAACLSTPPTQTRLCASPIIHLCIGLECHHPCPLTLLEEKKLFPSFTRKAEAQVELLALQQPGGKEHGFLQHQ